MVRVLRRTQGMESVCSSQVILPRAKRCSNRRRNTHQPRVHQYLLLPLQRRFNHSPHLNRTESIDSLKSKENWANRLIASPVNHTKVSKTFTGSTEVVRTRTDTTTSANVTKRT